MTKYILFEGMDGVGKTSLAKELVRKLDKALYVEEIGFSEIGKNLREPFLVEKDEYNRFLMAMLIRRKNYDLLKTLEESYDYIVLDRGHISTMVYQYDVFNSYRELNVAIESHLKNKFIKPDKTFFIKRVIKDIVEKMKLEKNINIDAHLELYERYNQSVSYLRSSGWNIYDVYNINFDRTLDYIYQNTKKR